MDTVESVIFFAKADSLAKTGKLLLQCQSCKEEKAIKSSPNISLPFCPICKQKTDWTYSHSSIDILRAKGLA